MMAKTLRHTLPDLLAKLQTKTINETLGDVEGKALIKTLADQLIEVKTMSLWKNWILYRAKEQIDTYADTLAEVQDETHGNKFKDLEADAHWSSKTSCATVQLIEISVKTLCATVDLLELGVFFYQAKTCPKHCAQLSCCLKLGSKPSAQLTFCLKLATFVKKLKFVQNTVRNSAVA